MGISTPVVAQVPSDLMENCKQWKITYPTGEEDKTLCSEANNEFFYVNADGDAIVFKAPIRNDNGTTPNSDNIRSELRERKEDGSSDIYWTTAGTHVLYVKQAITHLPIKKPQLVATQIHGDKEAGIDDSMVMRLQGSHLFLSFNGGDLRSDVTIKTDYNLGDIHEVIFKVIDGKHYCYYSEDGNLLNAYEQNNAEAYLIKADGNDYVMDLDYDQSYFKVGNYTQSNPSKELELTGDPDNYGEVWVYDFYVKHGEEAVSGVSLSPSTLNITVANTQQILAHVSPANATNKEVNFTSSNSSVATVDANGWITAIAKGEAVIKVTTAEGGYNDTCTVTVVEDASGANLAWNQSITGTGAADGEHVVDNLIDGSTTTRWSVSGFPQSATIDLGAQFSIGRTEVVCYSDRAYKYTISVASTENGTYTEVVDRTENTTPGTEQNPIVDVFTGVNGRFVKITVTGADSYTGSWVSLSELRVYKASSLGITEIHNSQEVVLWPNPVKDIIHFANYDYDTLEVYDSLGKLVMYQPINGNSLDMSNFIAGLYVFKMSNATKTIIKRIVKL